MQAKKRYALVASVITVVVIFLNFHKAGVFESYERGQRSTGAGQAEARDGEDGHRLAGAVDDSMSSWSLQRAKDLLFTSKQAKPREPTNDQPFDPTKLRNGNQQQPFDINKPTLINHPAASGFAEAHQRNTLCRFGELCGKPSFSAHPSAFLPPPKPTYDLDDDSITEHLNKAFESIRNHGKTPIPNSSSTVFHQLLPKNPRDCTLERCLDMTRCSHHASDLRVFIYPQAFEAFKYKKSTQWSLYERIIYIIKQSQYFTTNPEEACIFVSPYDTTVRDPLDDLYVEKISEKTKALPHWNSGQNHLIFNLYSGTWPDYAEDLRFDYGYAMLAKASFSREFYRPGYDISLPLFKKEQTFFKGNEKLNVEQVLYPSRRKYLVTFKGKRYLTGIGSETRNLLYQIDNESTDQFGPSDVIMLTTCKHGNDWEKYADARCKIDNDRYAHYDYQEMMVNSTFCLVPRGRRLGSFRFLESLQSSCIPVVMANSWVLPFEEVLDWNAALFNFDERHHILSPLILRHVGNAQIFEFRQQGVFLYHAYFSSLERIVLTALEVIRERIYPQLKKPQWVWNHGEGMTGALVAHTKFSNSYDFDYPFFNGVIDQHFRPAYFTTVIQVVAPQIHGLSRVLKTLEKSKTCGQVLLIWNLRSLPTWLRKQLESYGKVEILEMAPYENFDDISAKFGDRVSRKIRYEAVLCLDDDVTLVPDEIDFAFQVWKTQPERLVGFPNRLHYWLQGSMSDADGRVQKITRWAYTSKFHNEYSLVLTGAAFLHKYYLYTYTNSTNIGGHQISRDIVNKYKNCEDILMNFVIADITGKAPIKVTQRKRYKSTDGYNDKIGGMEATIDNAPLAPRWTEKAHFQERQICMNKFFEDFGYMPLVSSQFRLDPTLYRDNVAAWRKQYKSIEVVGDE